MLVLSRQRDQAIMIGEDVTVSVVDIRGDKVRLGINAPKHVRVDRQEVYDAIRKENKLSAAMTPNDLSAVSEPVESIKPPTTPVPFVKPVRLAVLVSGGGTTLQNILDQIAAGKLNARIEIVIASKPGVYALERAAKAGLRTAVVDRKRHTSSESLSGAVFEAIDAAGAELVCLAGWLSLLDVPLEYEGRVMNIHPALLPGFGGAGMYGGRVHEAVLNAGCKVSGCTVHFVNNEYDAGPIVLQRCVSVQENDTPETLAKRVFDEEKLAYPAAIKLFAENRLRVRGKRVEVLQKA